MQQVMLLVASAVVHLTAGAAPAPRGEGRHVNFDIRALSATIDGAKVDVCREFIGPKRPRGHATQSPPRPNLQPVDSLRFAQTSGVASQVVHLPFALPGKGGPTPARIHIRMTLQELDSDLNRLETPPPGVSVEVLGRRVPVGPDGRVALEFEARIPSERPVVVKFPPEEATLEIWLGPPARVVDEIEQVARRFPSLKLDDVRLVDQALKTQGEFGPTLGDFSQGLAHHLDGNDVTIEDLGDSLQVMIVPRSGNWDFSAIVEKGSGKLRDPVVGTIEPRP